MGASIVRALVSHRSRSLQVERQDAVLEATRMLRQLLETGATSVNQAISLLAERGPVPLRPEFRVIAARSIGKRHAWKEARDRVGEPLFDMLAAAVLIQRPGGGELVPLFADLESSVSAAQEVEPIELERQPYDELDVAVIRALQGNMPVCGEPYAPAAAQGWPSLVKGARLRSWSRRSS